MEYYEYMNEERNSSYIEGDRTIHLTYENTRLSDYEKLVIIENKCSALLEMKCIIEEDNVDIFYSAKGYQPLGEYISKKSLETGEILEIIAEILRMVKKCEDYLLAGEEMVVNSDCIFYNPSDKSIKLLYIPHFYSDRAINEQICELADCFIQNGCSSALTIKEISDYKVKISADNYKTTKLIWMTQDAQRSRSSFVRSGSSYEPPMPVNAQHMVMEAPAQYNVFGDLKSKFKNLVQKIGDL